MGFNVVKVQANETNFELHTLGWKAFQKLCNTITTEIFGQTIQVFFDSHDGGRDGAFHGQWRTDEGIDSATFTVQCKFTAEPSNLIRLSDLAEELEKASRLAERGLCDHYILFTNSKLTGSNDETIRAAFEEIDGIENCLTFGREKITSLILENKRLRMLAPRIYGLGDLSQILDERAYDQAQEVLSSMGDDLSKFIITDAYNKSANALRNQGFVLLLGEPMCGKSTIAAALSLSALDNWGCSTLRVFDAADFKKHFNPHEKQLFWVDDAFGDTQYVSGNSNEWNKVFPEIKAAIKNGSKFIFTSRTYIYNMAKKHLKQSTLPVLKESQVVIHVEDLTEREREEILYNHIRRGHQPSTFKSQIKPFLRNIAHHEDFAPEIARRLGDPLFTKKLRLSDYSLNNYLENPLELLCEVIEQLDKPSQAAIALIFINDNQLPSPISLNDHERYAVELLGASCESIRDALSSLSSSLVIQVLHDGNYYWKFKHPTIRDAFSTLVAKDPDLLDIYLAGADIDDLLSEVTCGDVGWEGASVIIPENRYDKFLELVGNLNLKVWITKRRFDRFLSQKCDKKFLTRFIEVFPEYIGSLQLSYPLSESPEIVLFIKLYHFGLLTEEARQKAVFQLREMAVDIPDAGFLKDDIVELITDEEFNEICNYVASALIPNLSSVVKEWEDEYEPSSDPEIESSDFVSTLDFYEELFAQNEQLRKKIKDAQTELQELIERLTEEHEKEEEESDLSSNFEDKDIEIDSSRSIFDDVDAEI